MFLRVTVCTVYALYCYIYTVLPRLVRMGTFKLMRFSGFVLTQSAYYPKGRTIREVVLSEKA